MPSHLERRQKLLQPLRLPLLRHRLWRLGNHRRVVPKSDRCNRRDLEGVSMDNPKELKLLCSTCCETLGINNNTISENKVGRKYCYGCGCNDDWWMHAEDKESLDRKIKEFRGETEQSS